MSINRTVTDDELTQIRGLDDFNLVMLISEIHDHGWHVARRTLAMMPGSAERPVEP
jgi:hypothetical protein